MYTNLVDNVFSDFVGFCLLTPSITRSAEPFLGLCSGFFFFYWNGYFSQPKEKLSFMAVRHAVRR